MPIKETLGFDAETYQALAKSATTEWLQQQEVGATRKSVSSGYGLGAGIAGATATGGVLVLLAAYKGRSLGVAYRKLKIIRAELRRRQVALHKLEPTADILRPIAVGALGTMIGLEIGDFVGDHSGLMEAAHAAHLPVDALPSTGLLDDPGAAAQGAAGAIENLIDTGGTAAAVAAEPIAYHAGMVQVQAILTELRGGAVEALLEGSVEPSYGCRRSVGATQATCKSCDTVIEQGTYWRE